MTELSLAVQDVVEESDGSARAPLTRRETIVEACVAVALLCVVVPLALTTELKPDLDAPLLVALVLSYGLMMRIRFDVGFGYTAPTQIVLVPMLLLLPAPLVPLLVVAGTTLGNLPEYLNGRRHPSRVLLSVGDAWHAVGPALVLVLAGPVGVSLSNWPIYVAALLAQFAFDLASVSLREWLWIGVPPRMQLSMSVWTFVTDALLSCIGLMAALAGRDDPGAALLVLPAAGLLELFARERKAREKNDKELKHAYEGATQVLSDVLEADDEYTGLHSRDVVSLSLAVAHELKLDEAQRQLVEFGALLHDVGKIRMPSEIINKAGPLTDKEWEIIKRHTIEGQRMLDQVGGVLGEVGKIVRSSHERWDGKGYPDGLAGEQIPLESSIISCTDAFHAMISDRSYRAGCAPEEALVELLVNSGTQFRPEVVDVLTRIIEKDLRQPGRRLVRGPKGGALEQVVA